MPHRVARCSMLLLALVLAGCTSSENAAGYSPPQRRLAELSTRPAEAMDPLYVADPLEEANRRVYKFNAKLDRHLLIPVVEAYEEVTPGFVRKRVSSFFLNLGEVNTFANSVLQGRVGKAIPTFARFLINSTVGVAGLFDVATELGIPRQSEDFGQTLGSWGIGSGPYLVLPALGPSNLRDTVGTVLDWATFSFVIPSAVEGNTGYEVINYGLRPIDTRYRVAFRYHATGSPFEYELVRYALSTARDVQIGQ